LDLQSEDILEMVQAWNQLRKEG